MLQYCKNMGRHHHFSQNHWYRSNRPEVFLGTGVLKICSKFTGEHPCRSVISTKLLCSVVEIAHRHGCSPVNVLHIFRTPFPKNTSGRLLLTNVCDKITFTFRLITCFICNDTFCWVNWCTKAKVSTWTF